MIAELNGLILPEDFPLRRALPPIEEREVFAGCALDDDPPHGDYDRRTLFYAGLREGRRRVRLIGPRLLNLGDAVRGARFAGPDGPLSIARIVTSRRYDEVILKARAALPRTAFPLTVTLDGEAFTLTVDPDEPGQFAGRRVLVAISKDNRPEWIRDWIRWHRVHHGCDGVVLIDNGSTAYTPEALAARLAAEEPDVAVRIVSAPFPYGTGHRLGWRTEYLQSAMIAFCTRRFLRRAAAILSVDIDELVLPQGGRSVFAEIGSTLGGYVKLHGNWVLAEPREGHDFRHADHVYARPGDPAGLKCGFRPPRLLPFRRLDLNPHVVHGARSFAPRNRPRWRFIHCRGISTSWKSDRRTMDIGALAPDPDLIAAHRVAYGETTTGAAQAGLPDGATMA